MSKKVNQFPRKQKRKFKNGNEALDFIGDVHESSKAFNKLIDNGYIYVLKVAAFCNKINAMPKGCELEENVKKIYYNKALICALMFIKLSENVTHSRHYVQEVETCISDVKTVLKKGNLYLSVMKGADES